MFSVSGISAVLLGADMSQYCTFSRTFLGKMLPADTPLPWLSVFEVGHGWMKGRSTRSCSLFVALILDGFQRINSFCSPIDLSSK